MFAIKIHQIVSHIVMITIGKRNLNIIKNNKNYKWHDKLSHSVYLSKISLSIKGKQNISLEKTRQIIRS